MEVEDKDYCRAAKGKEAYEALEDYEFSVAARVVEGDEANFVENLV